MNEWRPLSPSKKPTNGRIVGETVFSTGLGDRSAIPMAWGEVISAMDIQGC